MIPSATTARATRPRRLSRVRSERTSRRRPRGTSRLRTVRTAAATTRFVRTETPAAARPDAMPEEARSPTLQKPCRLDMIGRLAARSTWTAWAFMATSTSPAKIPKGTRAIVSVARPPASAGPARPTAKRGSPTWTTRRLPYRSTSQAAMRVPAKRPAAKPVSAIPSCPSPSPSPDLIAGMRGASVPRSQPGRGRRQRCSYARAFTGTIRRGSVRTSRTSRTARVATRLIAAAPTSVSSVPIRSAIGPAAASPSGMSANEPSAS